MWYNQQRWSMRFRSSHPMIRQHLLRDILTQTSRVSRSQKASSRILYHKAKTTADFHHSARGQVQAHLRLSTTPVRQPMASRRLWSRASGQPKAWFTPIHQMASTITQLSLAATQHLRCPARIQWTNDLLLFRKPSPKWSKDQSLLALKECRTLRTDGKRHGFSTCPTSLHRPLSKQVISFWTHSLSLNAKQTMVLKGTCACQPTRVAFINS